MSGQSLVISHTQLDSVVSKCCQRDDIFSGLVTHTGHGLKHNTVATVADSIIINPVATTLVLPLGGGNMHGELGTDNTFIFRLKK